MSSEWLHATLGEICSKQNGAIQTGPFGSQLHTSDYKEVGIPVVMPTNIGDGGIATDGIARIDCLDVERLQQHKLQLNDIVFSRRGDVTKNALIRTEEVGWLCGTGCLKVRLGEERIANPKFISYYLRLSETKEWLVRHAVGATMPNLNTGILSAVPITLPPLKTQLEIAAILGALDDRITLLRETNATLEAIAQALFKSWFVDFDPVRAKMEGRTPEGMDEATAALFPDGFETSELGEVPRGWRSAAMEDVSIVGIGKTPPRKEQHWFSEDSNDVRWVSIRDMGICGTYASTTNEFLTAEAVDKFNVRRVPDNTVLMSFKMTIGRVAITDGEMTTNEAIAHFRLDPASQLSTEFIYLHLRQFDFSRLSSTSSIADAVNSKTVRQIPILVPSREVATAFQEKIGVVFEMLKSNEQQAQTLSTLRDTLLPRLISGQLRLPEAQAATEAALGGTLSV
ncbi:MAG: restriction endonuclease subunit S [Comamonas sp.]|nr:restriction endonuclease subunit S [Comamonas sp.]